MSHLAIPKEKFVELLKHQSKKQLVDSLLELLHTSDEIYLDDGESSDASDDSRESISSRKSTCSTTVELLESEAGPVSEDMAVAGLSSGNDSDEAQR